MIAPDSPEVSEKLLEPDVVRAHAARLIDDSELFIPLLRYFTAYPHAITRLCPPIDEIEAYLGRRPVPSRAVTMASRVIAASIANELNGDAR